MTELFSVQRSNNIPQELRERAQWINWKYESVDGVQVKRPCAGDGTVFNALDPKNWKPFYWAANAVEAGLGIGYVLSIDDPYVCIDLDDADKLNDGSSDKVRAMHNDLMAALDSYTELSPSGKGYHVWIRAEVPPNGVRSSADCLELYSAARFMTFTGKMHPQSGSDIVTRNELANALHSSMHKAEPTKLASIEYTPYPNPERCPFDILNEIEKWSNGEEFNRKARAPVNAPDGSGIDMAVMNAIVHCVKDPEMARKVFNATPRASREKWSRRRDYQDWTIARAFDILNNTPKVYVGGELARQLREAGQLPQLAESAESAAESQGAVVVKLTTFDELMQLDATAKPVEFITEQLTPVGEVTLLSADGGVGKTMASLQWGLSVAAGDPFFGHASTQCPVLFVTGEDDARTIAERASRIANIVTPMNIGHYRRSIGSNFRVMEMIGECLWREDRRVIEGVPTLYFELLERKIVETGSRLVFVDNVSGMFRANDMDKNQVYSFVTALRKLAKRTNCAIVLLAHVSAASATGTDKKGYFGSTAWHNAARSRINMSVGERLNGQDVITFEPQKSNYGPKAESFKLTRGEFGVLFGFSTQAQARAEESEASNTEAEVINDIRELVAKQAAKHAVLRWTTRGPERTYDKLAALNRKRYPDISKNRTRIEGAIRRLILENRLEISTQRDGNRNMVEFFTGR